MTTVEVCDAKVYISLVSSKAWVLPRWRHLAVSCSPAEMNNLIQEVINTNVNPS